MGMKPYYDDGKGIVIYHGDWREIETSLFKQDLLLTDPPYGILNLGDGSSCAIRKSKRAVGSGKLKNRILNTSAITWDIPPTVQELDRLRACASTQIIWGGNYFPLPPCRGILVWDKQQPWENFSQVEIAWTSMNRPAALFSFKNGDSKQHPTQKPLELMTWCLSFVPEAQTVFDPFMGSGTTLRAAKDLGRKAIGIEIEERYCEIAARRLSQEVLALA
jgi:DNA modification methylase